MTEIREQCHLNNKEKSCIEDIKLFFEGTGVTLSAVKQLSNVDSPLLETASRVQNIFDNIFLPYDLYKKVKDERKTEWKKIKFSKVLDLIGHILKSVRDIYKIAISFFRVNGDLFKIVDSVSLLFGMRFLGRKFYKDCKDKSYAKSFRDGAGFVLCAGAFTATVLNAAIPPQIKLALSIGAIASKVFIRFN